MFLDLCRMLHSVNIALENTFSITPLENSELTEGGSWFRINIGVMLLFSCGGTVGELRRFLHS